MTQSLYLHVFIYASHRAATEGIRDHNRVQGAPKRQLEISQELTGIQRNQAVNHDAGLLETMVHSQASGSELSPASRATQATEIRCGTVEGTEAKVRAGPDGQVVDEQTAGLDE